MTLITKVFHLVSALILANCISILLLSPVSVYSEIIVEPKININSSSKNDTNAIIWDYLLNKYSSSGQYLTSQNISKIIDSSQKCSSLDGNESINSSQVSPVSNSFLGCDGIQLLENDLKFHDLNSLKEICPKLVYLIDNPSCCDTRSKLNSIDDEHLAGKKKDKEKPTSGEVWGYGILCVTIISLSSLAGVSVMPFMKKAFYKHLLTALVGLAVGSLTGSAIFHLLPQAFKLSNNDPNHEYLLISLMACGGIWLFFMVERILKIILDYKDRKDSHWKREKISSIISSTPENSTISMLENGNCIKGPVHKNGTLPKNGIIMCVEEPGIVYECQEQAIKASFGHQERPRLSSCHDHSVKFEQGKDSVIATVAWMIIFGDGLHNFIDGLSIGAAFNESILTGVSISVAVLCEELPHELGDFAVLLNAGMSIRQALTYNFLSACTCYLGLGVGIYLGEVEASIYIFALAGGMFLYIALVDMVPEMNEIAEETSKISLKKGITVLGLQNLGLFTGITTLYLLAKFQDSIQF